MLTVVGKGGEGRVVCREAGVVGVMEGGWSEAVVESDVGSSGGGCGEVLLRAALVVVVWLWLVAEAIVVGVVVKVVVVWLVQNNDSKRKTLPQRITARLT